MGRHKRNKKNGAGEETQEDVPPDQMSLQNGELEVNAKGSAGSPDFPGCFTFGVRITMDGVATSHSSHSVSRNSVPLYDSQTWHMTQTCLVLYNAMPLQRQYTMIESN